MKSRTLKIEWNKFDDIVFNEQYHSYTLYTKRLISCTQVLKKFKNDIFNENFILEYSKKHKLDPDYVKELWRIKAEVGTTKGTELHFYIESFLKYNIKNDISIQNEKESKYFHNFLKDHPELELIKTEYITYDKDLLIAGTIDALFRNKKTGKYIIVDWKTNKEIGTYSKTRFKSPISILYQSDIVSYTLQLSIYQYILEKNLGIDISDRWLVHFNYKNEDYVKYKIDYKKFSVQKILKSL